jgi:hypothetical protein
VDGGHGVLLTRFTLRCSDSLLKRLETPKVPKFVTKISLAHPVGESAGRRGQGGNRIAGGARSLRSDHTGPRGLAALGWAEAEAGQPHRRSRRRERRHRTEISACQGKTVPIIAGHRRIRVVHRTCAYRRHAVNELVQNPNPDVAPLVSVFYRRSITTACIQRGIPYTKRTETEARRYLPAPATRQARSLRRFFRRRHNQHKLRPYTTSSHLSPQLTAPLARCHTANRGYLSPFLHRLTQRGV